MKKVFFLLVKRLQELQCHKNNYNTKESKLQQPLLQDDQNDDKSTVNETSEEKSMGSNVTTSAKGGLSGRRTQSQSKCACMSDGIISLNVTDYSVILMAMFTYLLTGNIDNKSSINNGICCSTKYTTKPKRKNSNISQQDFDKKSAFSNKSNNNEHFDGIGQIIAANNAGDDHYQANLKQKRESGGKEKEKKLHGSLPNHLDTDVDGYEGSDDTNSSCKYHLLLMFLTFE